MKHLTDKQYLKIYTEKVIKFCYPYCVICDLQKHSIAFWNRNYYFLRGYQEGEGFWFDLSTEDFGKLQNYLSTNKHIQEQHRADNFVEYYLYGNPDAPKTFETAYKRYREMIDNIIALSHNKVIESRLKYKDEGFDFGQPADGVYIEDTTHTQLVNVYELAKKEVASYPITI